MKAARLIGVCALTLGLGFACLTPPGVNGKVCTVDAGSCAAGEVCALSVAGHELGLGSASAGLCAAADSGCNGLTCPEDAGFYICGGGTCFASGAESLGGLPCWTGIGRCRAEGLYEWAVDGGTCLTDGTSLPPQSECRLDGGHGPRCACDGVDDNCDGLIDDVPPRPSFTLAPEPLGGACAEGDGGVELPPLDDGGLLPGVGPVGSCALFDLGVSYAVGSIDVSANVASSACGVAGGATVLAKVYAFPSADGGYLLIGEAPGAGGTVSVEQRVVRLAVCVPASAAYSGLRIGPSQIDLAQECDTTPSSP